VAKTPIDADKVARMVAARDASDEAKSRAAEAAAQLALREPVAPTARSRWSFGVVLDESSEGDTLVIRCYPRKVAFTEDESPFVLEPRGWLIAAVATATTVLVSWVIGDLVATLTLALVLALGLILAHRSRTIRIHITRLNQFVVYERDPTRPIGIGRSSDLSMDVHAYPGNNSMRCKWVHARGPKWESSCSFQLESLPRADWLTVQRFIDKHGLHGL
jgi:hypothetical protein